MDKKIVKLASAQESERLQKGLLAQGYAWGGLKEKRIKFTTYPIIHIYPDTKQMFHSGARKDILPEEEKYLVTIGKALGKVEFDRDGNIW